MTKLDQKEDARTATNYFTFLKLGVLYRMFKKAGKDMMITFTNKMNKEKL